MVQEAWIECVPNFSEGRRQDVIDAIVGTLHEVEGAYLLDVEMDADHNRSVVSFVARPGAIVEAGVKMVGKALELIDLNSHEGQHPRMGACDVFPLIPLTGVTVEDCVEICHQLGRAFASVHNLPSYLYEEAATRPDRTNLASVRKSGPLEDGGEKVGAFEWLRANIPADATRTPDYGPNAVHPTGGVTAIGTRFFLIAYNVNLESKNLELAQSIAEQIREAKGGFPKVKALGFELADKGCVQVSMNLVDYRKTGIHHVYDKIESLANLAGVQIRESEIVGLIPQDAVDQGFAAFMGLQHLRKSQIVEGETDLVLEFDLEFEGERPADAPATVEISIPRELSPQSALMMVHQDVRQKGARLGKARLVQPVGETTLRKAFADCIRLPEFPTSQIVEERVREVTGGKFGGTIIPEDPVGNLRPFLRILASASPTPGGGSVSALVAALAAALGEMVSNLTVGKKKYADKRAKVEPVLAALTVLREQTYQVISLDSMAYDEVTSAFKLPEDTDEQKAIKEQKVQYALKTAASVPLGLADLCARILNALYDLAPHGNPNAISDVGVGSLLANAAFEGALMNVKINLKDIKDKVYVGMLNAKMRELSTAVKKFQAGIKLHVDKHVPK